MKRGIMFVCAIAFIVFLSSREALPALTADVNHSRIKIDFFYHGSTASVKGTADRGADLLIKITSPDRHEALRIRTCAGPIQPSRHKRH